MIFDFDLQVNYSFETGLTFYVKCTDGWCCSQSSLKLLLEKLSDRINSKIQNSSPDLIF